MHVLVCSLQSLKGAGEDSHKREGGRDSLSWPDVEKTLATVNSEEKCRIYQNV